MCNSNGSANVSKTVILGFKMHRDLERSFAYACGTPLDHFFLDWINRFRQKTFPPVIDVNRKIERPRVDLPLPDSRLVQALLPTNRKRHVINGPNRFWVAFNDKTRLRGF